MDQNLRSQKDASLWMKWMECPVEIEGKKEQSIEFFSFISILTIFFKWYGGSYKDDQELHGTNYLYL